MEKITRWYNTHTRPFWYTFSAIALVVVVVGLIIVFHHHGASPVMPPTETQNKTSDALETSQFYDGQTSVVPVAIPDVKVVPPRLSYQEALTTYSDSRIQFSEACDAVPMQSIFKNGTTIMIDNRGAAKTFSIGEKSFWVPAYDYALITLSYDVLPQNTAIDCGGKENAAGLLIER